MYRRQLKTERSSCCSTSRFRLPPVAKPRCECLPIYGKRTELHRRDRNRCLASRAVVVADLVRAAHLLPALGTHDGDLVVRDLKRRGWRLVAISEDHDGSEDEQRVHFKPFSRICLEIVSVSSAAQEFNLAGFLPLRLRLSPKTLGRDPLQLLEQVRDLDGGPCATPPRLEHPGH